MKKRKKRMKSSKRIAIVGNFTLDLNGTEKIGGPPLYSGFAIYMLGGEIELSSSISKKDFGKIPNFLPKKGIKITEKTTTFKIENINGKRKLILKAKSDKKLIYEGNSDGIILNPVCGEIEYVSYKKPIALDVQGFIRKCNEGEEVSYKPLYLVKNTNYLVLHANYEEYINSNVTVENLIELGFKEVIISYDEDGFEVYTSSGNSVKYKPANIGEYKIGTGDVLLASYFIYRLNAYPIRESTILAGNFVEWFSTEGYRLLFDIN
ncbi:MAG: hypothetical protein RXQ22_03660 [Sulfolobus sp.]